MKKLQSYKNKTSQLRMDSELIRRLKILAAEQKTTMRALAEGQLAELLEVKSNY